MPEYEIKDPTDEHGYLLYEHHNGKSVLIFAADTYEEVYEQAKLRAMLHIFATKGA